VTALQILAIGLLLLGSGGLVAVLIALSSLWRAEQDRQHAIEHRRQVDWQAWGTIRRIRARYDEAAQLAVRQAMARHQTNRTTPNRPDGSS
jgi:CBS domain containing-hemolysin-like protein